MTQPSGTADDLLPSDCHPKVRALLAYWQSKQRGRAMPARRDISPVEVPGLLAHLFLVDVPETGPMVYRLSGTGVVALMGQDVTGQKVGEATLPQFRGAIVAKYARIAAEARPFFEQARMRDVTNDFTDVDRLVLPLSDDGTRVNMLLGMTIRRLSAANDSAAQ